MDSVISGSRCGGFFRYCNPHMARRAYKENKLWYINYLLIYNSPFRNIYYIYVLDNGTEEFTPSIGIYNRCVWMNGHKHCGNFNIEGFATPNTVFPLVWKVSLIMMMNGLGIMAVTVLVALIGCCLQSCCGKSIFDLAGVAQAMAG